MDLIVITATALILLIGGALTAWGMWLEQRQQQRVLDIVASFLGEGRDPPEELLAQLVCQTPPKANGAQSRALRRTAAFLLVAAGACFLASWTANDAAREQMLLLVTTILGLTSLGILIIQTFGHRLGL